MKTTWQRWGWPLCKWLLALAVLSAIGLKFYDALGRLDVNALEVRPGWLVLSALLYLLGLFPSAWFWRHLLLAFGDRPRQVPVLRAYFMGQLGKYVPGKAVALLLRGSFVRGDDCRFGTAIISSFYEVFTTMAAGALVAALAFAIDPPQVPGLGWHPLLTGLLLLALCGIPLLPGIFNFMVNRMARRFRQVDSLRLPLLRASTLLLGLVATSAGWLMLGVGVWALLRGVLHEPPPWTLLIQYTGAIALAYVAGFLVVFLPGGIGAREYFLVLLLGFGGPDDPVGVAAVLLLRVLWTAVEVVTAGVLLAIRGPEPARAADDHGPCSSANSQAGVTP
jgi:uncharacterized membrane protein YbhN (UPF0104 family)